MKAVMSSFQLMTPSGHIHWHFPGLGCLPPTWRHHSTRCRRAHTSFRCLSGTSSTSIYSIMACHWSSLELSANTSDAVMQNSDGDAFFHCMVDAILGPSEFQDIGQYFPDTNPVIKRCSSYVFMTTAPSELSGQDIKSLLPNGPAITLKYFQLSTLWDRVQMALQNRVKCRNCILNCLKLHRCCRNSTHSSMRQLPHWTIYWHRQC